MGNQENKMPDEQSTRLPDRWVLIYQTGNAIKTKTLDDFRDEQIPDLVAQAIDLYGKENVRLAKVAFLKVSTSIVIDNS